MELKLDLGKIYGLALRPWQPSFGICFAFATRLESLSLSLSLSLVWDGMELKLTFRRNFSEEMMNRWFELTEIVSSVVYNNDGNALVRQYDSKWEYSTQSLYAIINFRGVVPVFTPSVWKI